MVKKETVLILHNIRSTYNVGAIFRTADGAGLKKIYLTGYTPRPVDQFGRVNKAIAKTAIGAEKEVIWEYFESVTKLINKLKKAEFTIVALEQNPKSENYKKAKFKFPLALLLGEEVAGITPELIKKCDQIIEIPMLGKKESLNVSVATGIAVYEIISRSNK